MSCLITRLTVAIAVLCALFSPYTQSPTRGSARITLAQFSRRGNVSIRTFVRVASTTAWRVIVRSAGMATNSARGEGERDETWWCTCMPTGMHVHT